MSLKNLNKNLPEKSIVKKKRLTKIEAKLKSFLEGLGLSLIIPPSTEKVSINPNNGCIPDKPVSTIISPHPDPLWPPTVEDQCIESPVEWMDPSGGPVDRTAGLPDCETPCSLWSDDEGNDERNRLLEKAKIEIGFYENESDQQAQRLGKLKSKKNRNISKKRKQETCSLGNPHTEIIDITDNNTGDGCDSAAIFASAFTATTAFEVIDLVEDDEPNAINCKPWTKVARALNTTKIEPARTKLMVESDGKVNDPANMEGNDSDIVILNVRMKQKRTKKRQVITGTEDERSWVDSAQISKDLPRSENIYKHTHEQRNEPTKKTKPRVQNMRVKDKRRIYAGSCEDFVESKPTRTKVSEKNYEDNENTFEDMKILNLKNGLKREACDHRGQGVQDDECWVVTSVAQVQESTMVRQHSPVKPNKENWYAVLSRRQKMVKQFAYNMHNANH